MPDGCCEMKRLYVSPGARGLGLGMALVDAIIREALRIGYSEMQLDSLPTMVEATSLYRKAGFVSTGPYYETPVEGTFVLRTRTHTMRMIISAIRRFPPDPHPPPWPWARA